MTRTTHIALAALLGLAVAAMPLTAVPAHAAGTVEVALPGGAADADPAAATSVTVSGSGFQSIQGGFGGIYVLFGWVSGPGWGPSAGGQVGSDYRYVPDSESKDNAGYERFVAFPGSETESAANGVLGADGTFRVDLTIPSASFSARDRTGATTTVDCLQVRCGVITIGAHGVKNANNETFTPVSFAMPSAGAGASAPATAGETAVPDDGEARVGYTAASAVAGAALAFTGQGFAVSEQVVATLDDGVVAVGPLTSGTSGEVAGVLPLPSDLRAGTHLLTLTGAASGRVAASELNVTAAAGAAGAPASVALPEPEVPLWLVLSLGIALLIAAGLVVASIVTALVRHARRRRARIRARGRASAALAAADGAAADGLASDGPAADGPAVVGAAPGEDPDPDRPSGTAVTRSLDTADVR